MTSTTATRVQTVAAEILGPVPAGGSAHRLRLARSAAAWFGLIATAVQVVVWLMIGVLTEHVDSPWWLWTAVPAAAAVVVLHRVVQLAVAGRESA